MDWGRTNSSCKRTRKLLQYYSSVILIHMLRIFITLVHYCIFKVSYMPQSQAMWECLPAFCFEHLKEIKVSSFPLCFKIFQQEAFSGSLKLSNPSLGSDSDFSKPSMNADYFYLNQRSPTMTEKFWSFWLYTVCLASDASVSWSFQSWQWKLTVCYWLEFTIKQVKKSWSTPIVQNTEVFSPYLHLFTKYLTILFRFFSGYPRA